MQTLERLLSDEFSDTFAWTLPPVAMKAVLHASSFVTDLRKAIRHGEVTESDIRNFAEQVTAPFTQGRALEGDLALAALAVALEDLPADFAEEYICKLAAFKLSELPLSIRVARLCLKKRLGLPKNETRVVLYSKRRQVIAQTYGRYVAAKKSDTCRVRFAEPPVAYSKRCGTV